MQASRWIWVVYKSKITARETTTKEACRLLSLALSVVGLLVVGSSELIAGGLMVVGSVNVSPLQPSDRQYVQVRPFGVPSQGSITPGEHSRVMMWETILMNDKQTYVSLDISNWNSKQMDRWEMISNQSWEKNLPESLYLTQAGDSYGGGQSTNFPGSSRWLKLSPQVSSSTLLHSQHFSANAIRDFMEYWDCF